MSRLLHALIAVLVGNAVFFLLLQPRLPEHARHQPYQIDLGLVIDFWVCVVCWGLLEMLVQRRRSKSSL